MPRTTTRSRDAARRIRRSERQRRPRQGPRNQGLPGPECPGVQTPPEHRQNDGTTAQFSSDPHASPAPLCYNPLRVSPRYVQVHPRDNVAIIVNPDGVSAGTAFPSGLAAREAVPQAHKITLQDIPSGEAVMRYGQVIGHALRDIPAGAWVREDMLALPTAPPLDSLSLATAVPPPLPSLEGYTFEGYRN